MNTAWVAIWTSDNQYKNYSLFFYLGGLAVVAFLLSVVSFIRTASMALTNINASSKMHTGALRSVLHAPTSFYDVTPIGRIISRFSKGKYTQFEFFYCLPSFVFLFFLFSLLFVILLMTILILQTCTEHMLSKNNL